MTQFFNVFYLFRRSSVIDSILDSQTKKFFVFVTKQLAKCTETK